MFQRVIYDIVEVYIWVLIARILLSWFPATPGGSLERVVSALDKLTEPVLAPVRRVLPQVRIGGMGLDLSPLVVLLLIQFVVLPLLLR